MLIEDDLDDRHFFCETLSDISPEIECIHFSNGLHAFEYLQSTENLPEIIFTDLYMHLMDGIEFISEVKNDDKLKHLPVYIYSTSFLIGKLAGTGKENVAGYILKTPNFEDIQVALKEILKQNFTEKPL